MQEPGLMAQERGHESGSVQAPTLEGAGDLVIQEITSGWTGDGLCEGFVLVVFLRRNVDQR